MQKACLAALIFLCFLASSCTSTVTQPPASVTAIPSATLTLTPSPALTATSQPTLTPAPPTITPLPTIPTFTPTFDVRTIVTATPAPKAECPKEDSSISANFQIPTNDKPILAGVETSILSFLNIGGSFQAVVKRLGKKGHPIIQDVTGDGIPELLFRDFRMTPALRIFTCKSGQYEMLTPEFSVNNDNYLDLSYSIHDINQNGLAEIIVVRRSFSGSGFYSADVLEWDGNKFRNLLQGWMGLDGLRKISVEDLDGMPELGFTGGLPGEDGFKTGYPWRVTTDIVGWNGSKFVLEKTSYGMPQYRFQAIQDADRFVLAGDYKDAMSFYQDSIFSQELDWWSEERKRMSAVLLMYESYDPFHTEKVSLGMGTPDPTEYPRLAAYAYYRMIILHIKLGEMDAAKTQFATLQEKFPVGNPGHPYVEMANAFWDAYQSTGKMYDACGAAIAYADAHPEILTVLGSDYHGWQSHIYVPADVCPFR